MTFFHSKMKMDLKRRKVFGLEFIKSGYIDTEYGPVHVFTFPSLLKKDVNGINYAKCGFDLSMDKYILYLDSNYSAISFEQFFDELSDDEKIYILFNLKFFQE